ncbi:transport and Golgi organization protein 1 homolog isoform X3 [Sciurus carolinensis]|uniref:transport and Golgi organization protein 1 homolog isoform X3 n=1 Tax=Sciurus carolinensis TaxID=30640 RepID=UPI001FB26853|nr:transport and Golgi organization protein 1 homolog isoform X3 [Sciurus carolinensis]
MEIDAQFKVFKHCGQTRNMTLPGSCLPKKLLENFEELVATLPNGARPGPDFYGLQWKPVLLTVFLGIVSFAIFFWRTILIVKETVYQVTEQQISEKLKNMKKENEELVQTVSNFEQKIKESKKHVQEIKKQNMVLSDAGMKYKDKIKLLEENNEILEDRAKSLHVVLESEREQNVNNEDLIIEKKNSVEKLKAVISMIASEFSQVQIALHEAKLSEYKVKCECHRVQEENDRLKKKKEQLQQEIQDWSESHAELSEQIKSFEKSQRDLEVALTQKDENINALTNYITQLNRIELESECEGQNEGGGESDEPGNGEVGGDQSENVKYRVKQLMDVSWMETAVSVVEEDLKRLQVKLRGSMNVKCNLEDQIKKLEDDRNSLQSAKAGLQDECKTLSQKVDILNELYQQEEMALHRKLSREECERQERAQRLSAADEKAILAAQEVKTYKRRIEEMEEEIQKAERSFKNQIATHEKKAHDNWLKAHAAERAIAEERREAANLRHKLLEMTQKMALGQDEPVILKPMAGRAKTKNPPPRGSMDGPFPHPRWSSEASGKRFASDPERGPAPVNSSSRSSSPAKVMDEGKVNMATKGPPHFPEVSLMVSPVVGPLPAPVRYGLPPRPLPGPLPWPLQLVGPFGPPPFGSGVHPPLCFREYAPGVPPGKRDLPLDPWAFLPGPTPLRPLGSFGLREYFIPGTQITPPNHGPQDYSPSPAARDLTPSGSRDEPSSASQSSSQDCSQALKEPVTVTSDT